MQFFLPKESKFFPLLRGQVDDIVAAADLLVEFTKTSSHEGRRQIYTKIKVLENHCDGLTDTVFDELNKTFITPFDREDIHKLAEQLDDVLDLITGSSKRTVLYQPDEIPVSFHKMALLINEGVHCLKIAIDELDKVRKDPKVVKEQCANLHTIENKADDVYESFLIDLFANQKDAIELVKEMGIIQLLEKATDKAEEVADVIKTIIVKYA